MRCENNATDSACTRSLTPSLTRSPPYCFYFKILPPFLPPGELHVKLALCADACIDALIKAAAKDKRPTPTVAFLCTPTDVHVIPGLCKRSASRGQTRPGRAAKRPAQMQNGGPDPRTAAAWSEWPRRGPRLIP